METSVFALALDLRLPVTFKENEYTVVTLDHLKWSLWMMKKILILQDGTGTNWEEFNSRTSGRESDPRRWECSTTFCSLSDVGRYGGVMGIVNEYFRLDHIK